ncbi:Glyco_hydro_38 domain-containing protein/Glyco_hydro_38C domain-containing protein, partial [Cephalotus follicularis]
MWIMGDDFQYQYAESWFKEMDKLIHYVNKDGQVNAQYYTPSIYTDAKNAVNESWPLKNDDYFSLWWCITLLDGILPTLLGCHMYQVNDGDLVVQDSLGKKIEAQLVGVDNITYNLRYFSTKAYLGLSSTEVPKYWLLLQVSVPPLGWNTYFISKAGSEGKTFFSVVDNPQNETIEIGPGNLKMSFSKTSGQLIRMYNSRTG